MRRLGNLLVVLVFLIAMATNIVQASGMTLDPAGINDVQLTDVIDGNPGNDDLFVFDHDDTDETANPRVAFFSFTIRDGLPHAMISARSFLGLAQVPRFSVLRI